MRPASYALLTSGRFNVTVATPRSSRSHRTGLAGIADPLAPRRSLLRRGVEDGLAEGVIDNDRSLEIADLGRGAVALGNHLAPFGIVDALGGFAAVPQIAAAGGPAFRVEQVILANKAGEALVFRRRALEQLSRFCGVNGCGQLETDNSGNH